MVGEDISKVRQAMAVLGWVEGELGCALAGLTVGAEAMGWVSESRASF